MFVKSVPASGGSPGPTPSTVPLPAINITGSGVSSVTFPLHTIFEFKNSNFQISTVTTYSTTATLHPITVFPHARLYVVLDSVWHFYPVPVISILNSLDEAEACFEDLVIFIIWFSKPR